MSGWVWLGVAIVGACLALYGALSIWCKAGELETLVDLGDGEGR